MAALEGIEDIIRAKVEQERWTHDRLRQYLQQEYPRKRGFSICSIQRFCSVKGIKKTLRPAADELDSVVSKAVNMVNYCQNNYYHHY